MKKAYLFFILFALSFVLSSLDDWSTISSFPPINGFPLDLTVDRTKTLYLCGDKRFNDSESNSIISHSVVLKSANSGKKWTPSDNFFIPNGTTPYSAICTGIQVAPNGYIFQHGLVRNVPGSVGQGFVRRSKNHGTTWDTVNIDLSNPSYVYSDLKITSHGDIFLIGYVYNETFGGTIWVIQRSTDQGDTWEIVDDFCNDIPNQLPNCVANSIVIVDGAEWYFDLSTFLTYTSLIVKRSNDNGNTWQIMDNFTFITDLFFTFPIITYDPTTFTLFYSYGHFFLNRTRTYYVRRGTSNGENWTTLPGEIGNDLSSQNGFGIRLQDGVMFTVGDNSNNTWITLKSEDHGSTWSISDIFNTLTSTASIANSLSFDQDGNTYVTGIVSSTGSIFKGNWTIRKLNY